MERTWSRARQSLGRTRGQAALGDGAAWMSGFPLLIYILKSPEARGLGSAAWRDSTAPPYPRLSALDAALMSQPVPGHSC